MTSAQSVATPISRRHLADTSKRWLKIFFCLLVGAGIWFAPMPTGIELNAWRLFAVFIFSIVGLILKPVPPGAIVITSVMILTFTKVMTFSQAFSGFANETVWLIVFAFFIARGFIKTGLGHRAAYMIMGALGKNTLGLSYGIILTDLVLAPCIPSVTARQGGIISPIVLALSKAFGSEPNHHPRKIGAFLIQTAFQGGAITSAMFLTAMSGNPLAQGLAKTVGIDLTWSSWALAAVVPGFLSLLVIPLFLYKFCAPEIKKTPEAKEYARKKLEEMGKVSFQEWVMITTFVILITLWIMAPVIGVGATVTALLGLVILIFSQVLEWDDILKEKGAWDILMWFSILVAMATYLNTFGFMSWFSANVVGYVEGYNWIGGFALIALLYFYSHYFFASNVAHITSMYAPFLLLAVGVGTPPALAALTLAFFSNLFGTLTTYGTGPAPIYFGAGYHSMGEWWKLGFLLSIVNIIIWLFGGGAWWYLLGFYTI